MVKLTYKFNYILMVNWPFLLCLCHGFGRTGKHICLCMSSYAWCNYAWKGQNSFGLIKWTVEQENIIGTICYDFLLWTLINAIKFNSHMHFQVLVDIVANRYVEETNKWV